MVYGELERRFRVQSNLAHAEAFLSWDEATMMPARGGAARAEAMATLAELRHEQAIDPALGELLERAAEPALDEWQRRNLELMRVRYRRATALPTELVRARTHARIRTEQAWRRQRADNDWEGFRPLLEEVVALEREAAQALGTALSLDPYDACIDGHDPGVRRALIDPIFDELAEFLPGFVEQAVERSAERGAIVPEGSFPVAAQRALGLELMKVVGFDLERGRLDTSHHPFCGGVPQDVRITTRYDEDDFLTALMGVLHESGHGKYEQALPARWVDQPVGNPVGMAVHESQSLLLEMQICRSRAFMELAAPHMRRAFPEQAARQPEAFTADNLYALHTRAERSRIRVDADEATYPCHILLRYGIERDLIGGRLEVRDIPARWDAEMRRLLHLDTRGDHRNGSMQDVHWASGAFGYFPSYTLGAMIAAQLVAALRRDVPDLDTLIARGDFSALDRWLGERIWSQASRFGTLELVEHATGSPLGTAAYRTHLARRYLEQA